VLPDLLYPFHRPAKEFFLEDSPFGGEAPDGFAALGEKDAGGAFKADHFAGGGSGGSGGSGDVNGGRNGRGKGPGREAAAEKSGAGLNSAGIDEDSEKMETMDNRENSEEKSASSEEKSKNSEVGSKSAEEKSKSAEEESDSSEDKSKSAEKESADSDSSAGEGRKRSVNLDLLLNWVPKYKRRKQYILFLEDISVSFDGFKALDSLTLHLTEGELRCVIGPNGAGKTTMMDVVTGHTRPDAGEAWFMDRINLLEKDEVFIAQSGICRKFQKPSVFESLTPWENLELALKGPKTVFSSFRAKVSSEEGDFLQGVLKLTGLEKEGGKLAGNLSHGQKQWLEIGMLLAQKPRILLLDEPVAGMTPREIEETTELLLSLEGSTTILVVEHDMEFVRSIARRVTVMHQGRVLAEGSMDFVSADPGVREAYLGGSGA
jgi:urea transport system ATP-binding protein